MNHFECNTWKYLLPSVLVLFFISGCSFKTDKYSHDILNSSETREITRNSIDSTITYDYELKTDGYIIGVEKSNGVDDYPTRCSDKSFEKLHSSLCKAVSSHTPNTLWGKNTILTHIVRFSPNDKSSKTCVLFSAYGNISNKDINTCSNAKINSEIVDFDYMKEAINSIELLRSDLRAKIKDYQPTHIFLVSTGWNTPQGESIQNYNDLFENLKKTAIKNSQNFKPLLVGISWHSYINNGLQGGGDFGIAQNDADEVGLFWAAPILHEVLEPLSAQYHIPLRIIGHSFGCRVITIAMSSKELYESYANSSKPVSFGLQCAFSGNRFLSKETAKRSEDDSLENFSEVSAKQFYTTSEHDKAVVMAPGTAVGLDVIYVGNQAFFDIVEKDTDFRKIFTRSTIDKPGEYVPALDCKGDKITLINASKIIKDRAPGTGKGGGSHSDVWDNEAANFIWDLLKVCENSK